MSLNRRKFLKNSAIGTAAALTGSGIYFPRPVNAARSKNYLLSQDGTSRKVFRTLKIVSIAQSPTALLPPELPRDVRQQFLVSEEQLKANNFTDNPTPYARRLNSRFNPLRGIDRSEELGPNPGFGTVQIRKNLPQAISFSGLTSLPIDFGVKWLIDQYKLTPTEIDGLLVPFSNLYDDWGTWKGDLDPVTGKLTSGSSLTEYETKLGHVTRSYQVEDPNPGGFGLITFFIDGGRYAQERLTIKVVFE